MLRARMLLLVPIAVAVAIACAFWPLAIYGITLAIFGLPHALVEVQWVGRRYGDRRHLAIVVVGLLTLTALSRLLALQLGLATATATTATIELLLGALLVVVVLPTQWRACSLRTAIALGVLAALVGAVALAPIDALLVLAIGHNVTPAGFIADRLRDHDATRTERRHFAVLGATCFLVLPAWLVTGSAAASFGLLPTVSSPFDGTIGATFGIQLADGIGAFAPSWIPADRALDLLRACAFLQVVHYVAVLYVMPTLGPQPQQDLRRALALRHARTRAVLVVGLALLFAIAFLHDFREARATYGILAAVHVWLEFPALLLALTPRPIAAVPS